MEIFEQICKAVVAGNVVNVKAEVQKAIDAQVDPQEIVNNGLIAGMNIVGPKMQTGEMFVPEVLKSAKSMQGGLELLKDLLAEGSLTYSGKIVIGTVAGDLHDIGKNLVAMILESSGYAVIDLGVNISAEQFVQAINEHQPQILGLSALLTTTMPEMKKVIDQIANEGLRDKVRVIVGGAPVSNEYATEIGADGYAADAAAAVDLAKELIA